jgi:hypothetical protein
MDSCQLQCEPSRRACSSTALSIEHGIGVLVRVPVLLAKVSVMEAARITPSRLRNHVTHNRGYAPVSHTIPRLVLLAGAHHVC